MYHKSMNYCYFGSLTLMVLDIKQITSGLLFSTKQKGSIYEEKYEHSSGSAVLFLLFNFIQKRAQ